MRRGKFLAILIVAILFINVAGACNSENPVDPPPADTTYEITGVHDLEFRLGGVTDALLTKDVWAIGSDGSKTAVTLDKGSADFAVAGSYEITYRFKALSKKARVTVYGDPVFYNGQTAIQDGEVTVGRKDALKAGSFEKLFTAFDSANNALEVSREPLSAYYDGSIGLYDVNLSATDKFGNVSDIGLKVTVTETDLPVYPSPLIKHQGIVHSSQQENNYFAWPSMARLNDGRLLVVSSGYREGHVDMFGQITASYSSDEGMTWTTPVTLFDSPLDDRDPGVTVMGDKIIVTIATHYSIYNPDGGYFGNPSASSPEYNPEWAQMYAKVTKEDLAKYQTPYSVVSTDNGKTFVYVGKTSAYFAPHGFTALKDGSALYIGYNRESGIGYATSPDGLSWSKPKPISAGGEPLNQADFTEPHAVQLSDGTIVLMFRSAKGIYQATSSDNGATFSTAKLICTTPGAIQTPPHLLQLTSGAIVVNDAPRYVNEHGADWSFDLGYPASIERLDGNILTVFYQRTKLTDKNTSLLYTVWKAPSAFFTVNLKTDGGNALDAMMFYDSERLEPGDLPVPTRTAYTFEGWFKDVACTQIFTGARVDKNIYLYAKWTHEPITDPIGATTPANVTALKESVELEGRTVESGFTVVKALNVPAGDPVNPGAFYLKTHDADEITVDVYIEMTGGANNVHMQTKPAAFKQVDKIASDGSLTKLAITPGAGTATFNDTVKTGWYRITFSAVGREKVYMIVFGSSGANLTFTDFQYAYGLLNSDAYNVSGGPRIYGQSAHKITLLNANDIAANAAFEGRNDAYAYRQIKEANAGSVNAGGTQGLCFSTVQTGAVYDKVTFDIFAAGSAAEPVFVFDEGLNVISVMEGQTAVSTDGRSAKLEKGKWYTVTVDLSGLDERVFHLGSWSGAAVEFYYANFVWTVKA